MTTLTELILKADKRAKQAMYDELRVITTELRNKHRLVVQRWKNKPDFRLMMIRAPNKLTGRVVIAGKAQRIWRYVDEGTKPHYIRAKRAPYLHFQLGYMPKTKPIAKYVGGLGKAFGSWKRKKVVHHPGSKARKFNKTYADNTRKDFTKRIQQAIQRSN